MWVLGPGPLFDGILRVKQIAVIAIGGAIGAVCRFLVSGYIQNRANSEFPFGTLSVNVSGCLLIGFLMQLSHQNDFLSPSLQALVVTGFLGALTTFSTFGHDTIHCAEFGLPFAVLNIMANVVFGIGAVLFGIMIAHVFGPQ